MPSHTPVPADQWQICQVDLRGSINLPVGLKRRLGLVAPAVAAYREFSGIIVLIPAKSLQGAFSDTTFDQQLAAALGTPVPRTYDPAPDEVARVQPAERGLALMVNGKGFVTLPLTLKRKHGLTVGHMVKVTESVDAEGKSGLFIRPFVEAEEIQRAIVERAIQDEVERRLQEAEAQREAQQEDPVSAKPFVPEPGSLMDTLLKKKQKETGSQETDDEPIVVAGIPAAPPFPFAAEQDPLGVGFKPDI